jgi:hypothetical protein
MVTKRKSPLKKRRMGVISTQPETAGVAFTPLKNRSLSLIGYINTLSNFLVLEVSIKKNHNPDRIFF